MIFIQPERLTRPMKFQCYEVSAGGDLPMPYLGFATVFETEQKASENLPKSW
jgi:hypothetical protein